MRTTFAWIALAVVGCGGSSSPDLDGGTDASADTTPADVAAKDVASDSSGGDSGACPDEHGLFSIAFSGQGCGTIAGTAPICIQETSCSITLATTGNGANEISGTTPIIADGSFSGAAIMQGTSSRTGCVGTWDNGTSTLTIDCGGTNTSQSCRATLVRTAASCN